MNKLAYQHSSNLWEENLINLLEKVQVKSYSWLDGLLREDKTCFLEWSKKSVYEISATISILAHLRQAVPILPNRLF